MKKQQKGSDSDFVRLDRWLWAARFFKTRALAKQAVEGGKVHLNDQKTKPGKAVSVGMELSIRRGFEQFVVKVVDVSDKRGPSKIAVTLYEETAESINRREKEANIRKMQQLASIDPGTRPDKKQRRQIHRFKNSAKHS